MRGLIPELQSSHPLGEALPSVYHDDRLMLRFLTAFDDSMAPILCTLDNLDSYLDPQLAPDDFVVWLAGWLGLSLEEEWPGERRRAFVAGAAELYQWRGTLKGLRAHVALYTGSEPEVEESGAVAWSPIPGAPVPGTPGPHVTVRVRVEDPSSFDAARVDAVVAAAKPAHVSHDVELLSG